MRRTILLFMLLLCTAAYAASTTTNYSLYKPAVGDKNWGALVNTNFDTIDTQLKANANAILTYMKPADIDTFSELELLVADATLLKAGTLTDTKYCIYDNASTSIVCNSEGGSDAITGTDTHVMFFDGTDNPAGEAGMTYNKSTNVLTVGGINSTGTGQSTINEGLVINDSGGNGAEDDLRVETDSEDNALVVDSSGNLIRMGDFDTNYVQVTTAGAVTFVGTGSINVPDNSIVTADVNWSTTTDLVTGGAVSWTNMTEGELTDGVITSGDIKNADIAGGDLAAAIAITSTGAQDYGGASGFEIPNAASPTVDAAGEIAVDTSSDHIEYYGAAARVLTYRKQVCFALETPVDADDNIPFFFPREAITVTDVYCEIDGGTDVDMVISDGTNALESINCDADGAEDDGSIANGTFTALERMEFDLTGTTGVNTWLNGCVTYVITED